MNQFFIVASRKCEVSLNSAFCDIKHQGITVMTLSNTSSVFYCHNLILIIQQQQLMNDDDEEGFSELQIFFSITMIVLLRLAIYGSMQ